MDTVHGFYCQCGESFLSYSFNPCLNLLFFFHIWTAFFPYVVRLRAHLLRSLISCAVDKPFAVVVFVWFYSLAGPVSSLATLELVDILSPQPVTNSELDISIVRNK